MNGQHPIRLNTIYDVIRVMAHTYESKRDLPWAPEVWKDSGEIVNAHFKIWRVDPSVIDAHQDLFVWRHGGSKWKSMGGNLVGNLKPFHETPPWVQIPYAEGLLENT